MQTPQRLARIGAAESPATPSTVADWRARCEREEAWKDKLVVQLKELTEDYSKLGRTKELLLRVSLGDLGG